MRLNQFVARSTALSRRAADEAITAGRVQVNDLAAKLGQVVTDKDQVTLDGQLLKPPETAATIMLNKPVGYVCSRRAQGNSPTIYQLLPKNLAHLNYVGRLDRGSSGLLILSADGPLNNRLSHPSFGKIKRYQVQLDQPLESTDAQRLEGGIDLDGKLSRMRVTATRGHEIRLELTTGLNRQIRKSLDKLGYKVITLQRTEFGPLQLGDLRPGHWRVLEEKELAWLE